MAAWTQRRKDWDVKPPPPDAPMGRRCIPSSIMHKLAEELRKGLSPNKQTVNLKLQELLEAAQKGS